MAKNNAKLIDVNLLIQAGIDPNTGFPLRGVDNPCELKRDIKKALRVKDEATAINRFTWYNLPKGLNGRLIERILYYRGQGILFPLHDKFYFLPYTLEGTIDVYGRFTGVTPLPWNGSFASEKEESPWIQGLVFNPVYDVADINDYTDKSPEELEEVLEKSCVILKDYSEQISQTNISRQVINDPILDVMSECFPFMRTALLNSTGVMGMKVSTENEQANVYAASNAVNKAALEGKKYIPIIGGVDFQEMTGGNVGKAEEFLLAMQALDNFRLGLYGLENGGLFQKKAHILQDEQDMNAGSVSLVMKDSLETRQDFCTICNSIWGTAMWVEATDMMLPEDDMTPGFTEEDVDTNKPDDMTEGGEDE